MKKDERLDDIFREGLSSVTPPPAPSQDWAAMARSAKTNAVLAGKGHAVSGAARWLRILGGGMAVLIGWYLSTSPEDPHSAERAAIPVSSPLLPSLPILDTEEELSEPATGAELSEAGMQGVDASPSLPSVHEDPPARSTEHLAALPVRVKNDQVTREEASKAHDPIEKAVEAKHGQQSAGAARNATHDEGAGGSLRSGAGLSMTNVAEGLMAAPVAPAPEPGHQVPPLLLLLPTPTGLTYQPMGTPNPVEADYVSNARWSLSPWISGGKSMLADRDLGTGLPDGLKSTAAFPNGFGLRVQYTLDRQLAFFTGVSLTSKGNLQGWIRSSPTLSTEYQLSGQYVEVPVALKFIQPLRGMDIYARAGLTFQFNRPGEMNRVVVHDEGSKQQSTLALAGGSMGTAIDLGAGIQIPLSDRLGLFIEPSYQMALSPAVKHPSFDLLPFNPRIHSFSIATGLSFQFH